MGHEVAEELFRRVSDAAANEMLGRVRRWSGWALMRAAK
jgi:hypothetical protein